MAKKKKNASSLNGSQQTPTTASSNTVDDDSAVDASSWSASSQDAGEATSTQLDYDETADEFDDEIASPAEPAAVAATPARQPIKPKQLLPQTAPPKNAASNSSAANKQTVSSQPRDQQQSGNQPHVSMHKRILEEIRELYSAPLSSSPSTFDGLTEIARALTTSSLATPDAATLHLPIPANKINVLVVGNHSAGKSSLINWYIDQKIQKESAAMETSNISFITHGRKRETFRGAASVRYNHLEGIEQFEGIMEHLTTEVCDSSARQFPLVDWIDSPGLADGKLQYAFEVNKVIEWLAERADLIFVLLETHGTTTVERTMSVLSSLHANKKCKHKLHIFLSKADDLKSEVERLKLISQLSQSLSRVVTSNESTSGSSKNQQFFGEHALEIKTIYRPSGFDATTNPSDFNQIGSVLELISQTVKSSVQKHCEQLEQHTAALHRQVEAQLAIHHSHESRNSKLTTWSVVMHSLVLVLPLMLLLYLFACMSVSLLPRGVQERSIVSTIIRGLHSSSSLISAIDASAYRYELLVVLLIVFSIATLFVKYVQRWRQPVASETHLAQLNRWATQLEKMQKPKTGIVARMWSQYISDAF